MNYEFSLTKNAVKTVENIRLAIHFLKDHDTPVIVEVSGGPGRYQKSWTSSYDCATTQGMVDEVRLQGWEVEWLEKFSDEVDQWYTKIRG